MRRGSLNLRWGKVLTWGLVTLAGAGAPALAAFVTLMENAQLPRCTRAIDPASAFGANAVQARPSFCNCATSRSGAFSAAKSLGPSPNSVLIGAAPGRITPA